MKSRIYYLAALLCITLFSACTKEKEDELSGENIMGDAHRYKLAFHFVDENDKSLAENLEFSSWIPSNKPMTEATWANVSRDCCSLEIILGKQSPLWDNDAYNVRGDAWGVITEVHKPFFIWTQMDEKDILISDFMLYSALCYPQEKLTYQIVCPQIFGDENKHEIVSHWHQPEEKVNGEYFFECDHIEIDSRSIKVEHVENDNYLPFINIVNIPVLTSQE